METKKDRHHHLHRNTAINVTIIISFLDFTMGTNLDKIFHSQVTKEWQAQRGGRLMLGLRLPFPAVAGARSSFRFCN